ncbi:MAG: ECF-type sigma factor [Planctomycetota bacterium]
MPDETTQDVTLCLQRMREGDDMARDELFDFIYKDLRSLAERIFGAQPRDQTLQPTALVHEAYIRLAGNTQQTYEDRQHFLCVAAMAMRQLITDQARARNAQKRGGGMERVMIEPGDVSSSSPDGIDLLALDEALTELARLDERQCRVVEMRFLAGLTADETAQALGISSRTVRLDWSVAKRFLASRLMPPEKSS